MKRKYQNAKGTTRIFAAILIVAMLLQIVGISATAVPPSTEVSHDKTAEPVIIGEDISKRGLFEKHFERSDGSFVAASYPEQIHYQNESGE